MNLWQCYAREYARVNLKVDRLPLSAVRAAPIHEPATEDDANPAKKELRPCTFPERLATGAAHHLH